MNKLYLLGGPPRTAKTAIMSGLARELGIAFIAADSVQHGVRNVLTGDPHQMLRKIEFSGSAEHKTSITEGGKRKPFINKGSESELTLKAIDGMLDYYRRNKESIAFEGATITPKSITDLNVSDFAIRAAFVGYTNPSHADQILAFAKSNPHDWINVWLEKESGDETKIREWVTMQSEDCIKLKSEAEKSGYPFFDISSMPYDVYVKTTHQYFTEI